MYTFQYTIADPIGIHARPAGLLAKEAKKYTETISIVKGEKKADATRLMAVMGLGVKSGDTITVEVEGENAEQTGKAIEEFLSKNL